MLVSGRDSLRDCELLDMPSSSVPANGHTYCFKPADYPIASETAVAGLISESTVTSCDQLRKKLSSQEIRWFFAEEASADPTHSRLASNTTRKGESLERKQRTKE